VSSPIHDQEAPLSTPQRSTFDWTTVSRATWIAAGGALVLLISCFMTWYSLGPASVDGTHEGLGKLVALLAFVALVVVAVELFASNVTLPLPSSLILIGIGGLSALLVLIKVLDKPYSGLSLGFGIWLALIAAIVLAVGGYLKMQEEA
jgi:hypothetical protein